MLFKDIYNEIIEEYNDYNEGDDLFEEYDYSPDVIDEGDVLDIPSESEESELIDEIERIEIPEEDVIIPKDEDSTDIDIEVDGVDYIPKPESEEGEIIIDEEGEDELLDTYDFGDGADLSEEVIDEEELPTEEPVEDPIPTEEPNPQIDDVDELNGVKKPSEFTFEELKDFVDILTDNEKTIITSLMEGTNSDNFVEGGTDIPNTIEVDEATAEDLPNTINKEAGEYDDVLSAISNDDVDYHFAGRNVNTESKYNIIEKAKLNDYFLGFVFTLPGVYIENSSGERDYIKVYGDNNQIIVDEDGNEFKITGLVDGSKNLDSTYTTDTSDGETNVIKLDEHPYDLRHNTTGKVFPIHINNSFDDVKDTEILGVVIATDDIESDKFTSYEDNNVSTIKTLQDIVIYYTEKSPLDLFDVYYITKKQEVKEEVKEEIDFTFKEELKESDVSDELEAKVIAEAARQLLEKIK